ncbi:biopolymer transporter ExbD [Rhodanobacter sp. FW510-R12]|uniref:ExbD/TolR family protein n=1 Tax=unclassified Rhodanobacter TaxID=2621553 RepID=UPI0007AA40DF|nr:MULTISPECIES: biopolymer transporter ExbD [unclassified Rhodanobacter]KZC16702.1 biopolymer transporter ExbD [Rhodanobacter sp. FW104-R8]KZC27437.1 biopolymer transporter ExbD [Rhodanobacter sp. FW510-T8]KZC31922.1 biopolymer transporter ExbD [Rhodanobacter sp. FW510-R10]
MAVSLGGNSGGPMSEINVTPLVDVMLVLLIIFMITAPLMSHSITIDLPTANPKTPDSEMAVPPLDLAVKQDGSMYFNDHLVTEAELRAQFAVNAQKSPQPELQIRADKGTEFKIVKKIIGDAKDSGMVHVAFMTTDAPKG